MLFDRVFENNQEWVQSKLNVDADYFTNLAKGQQPEILYIGCSDSRVTAEDMMGAQPGDIFVHRNIANMVINTDVSAGGVINYAVEHLGVSHVVVCGHYGCGGVKAAMSSGDLGVLNGYLREIRDVYRMHREELAGIADEGKRYDRLVELNVKEQCVNVMKTIEVQKARKDRDIQVHGWVFDLATGKIKDLEIDITSYMAEIQDIYQLDI